MVVSLRALKLKTRMVLILGLMALLQTGFIGLFALHYLNQSLDEQIGKRALHIAQTIATMPEIKQAVAERDSGRLNPLAKNLAERNQARFVVIGDYQGVRLAHPLSERIGKPMFDDDGDYNDPVLLHGKPYVAKAVGSLGATMRGKAPVFDESGEEVIGIISVGILLDRVEEIINEYRSTLYLVIGASFTLSVLTALWFAGHFKKAIFGLEPEQIGQLFQERNATLETVREGIISINREGHITTFNKAAVEMLGLSTDQPLAGRPIREVLPNSKMMEILESGKPQYDRDVVLRGKRLIVNRLPLLQENVVTGVVSSFRLKDELELVSRKLTQIQQYADSLRAQSHEYSNKLHTIAGLIQLGANNEALALIGQETRGHQELIQLLVDAVPDPVLSGALLGKYNRARELGLELVIDPESRMTDLPDTLPREQLVSIVGNLLDNAMEATVSHQGQKVVLSMSDYGDDLIFEIEDEGGGIPAELAERIFERGVTTKPGEGRGIGLHLVKRLVSRLGGTITQEPGDANGSRFTVYLPKRFS